MRIRRRAGSPTRAGSPSRVGSFTRAAAALVLTALIGVPELLLSPPPDPRADAAYTSSSATGALRGTDPDTHPRTRPQAPADALPDTTADTAVTFRGLVFDLCRAPALAVMSAWRKASPYGAVGIPYAGRAGECPDRPRLTRSWVAGVHRMGWRVLPLFTGSQPPCSPAAAVDPADPARRPPTGPTGPGTAPTPATTLASTPTLAPMASPAPVPVQDVIGNAPAVQGEREGQEAIRAAGALGITRGSALYVSLKSYDLSDAKCGGVTLDYVRAWNREVRRHGYVPGLRSHADAGVQHMEHARRAGTGDLPSAMWFARWNDRPSLYDERALHPYAWRVKRRIHQYAGEVTEEYGGHRLTVGRSLADAPVARIHR
ncbi:DUF1906 domain-containing protein [Streptomyces yaizuensis]|uniref:DUF1906 domain-containing protein n=1 Tax=Streptomyces yaizuensis TaxID=2989713 RepID=A0ABQ5P032_9ACTN|nr:DUF1906 domain-containing protein [Streptomyces sp. YSPA8]GLF95798.1 DUF1906 domain-containing protein [Streptomyces sp. YSPA8]